MEKQSKRQTKTRHSIQDALLELLQKKPIEEISVTELCELAGVNRTTFYNHYRSQQEVMNEISDNFLSDINTYLSGILASERKDHERHLVLLFQYMENHLLLSRTMLNNITDPRFSVKLMNLPAVLEMGKLLRPGISGALHVFVRSYILGGCYSILKDWINSDDRVSANEAVSIMITLVRNSYKGLL